MINNRSKVSVSNLFANTLRQPASDMKRTILSNNFWNTVDRHEQHIQNGTSFNIILDLFLILISYTVILDYFILYLFLEN